MTDMIVLAPLPPTKIPPVALPVEACMYCWYVLHPQQPYPETWSSTCCFGHRAWVETQLLARRQRRSVEKKGTSLCHS